MSKNTSMSSGKCILLFVRYPVKGKIKSRLSKELDEDIVLKLYKNFVLDIIETLKKGRHIFRVCFFPSNSKKKISNWLGSEIDYMPQRGSDLGERMKNAFIELFRSNVTEALIIGSDIPDLTNEVFDEAFNLEAYDAVIGPALDGGYYLIGFKKDTFLPYIFDGIEWGTEKVFKKTMEILRKYNYRVRILPVWQDVDRIEDLKALFRRNQNTAFAYSKTMEFLRSISEIL